MTDLFQMLTDLFSSDPPPEVLGHRIQQSLQVILAGLDERDARYHRAQAALTRYAPAQSLPRTLWARRSVFLLRGSALMVSEAFLPEILELPR